MSSKALLRTVTHVLIGSRRWMNRNVAHFASGTHGQKILELGSGRQDLGVDTYSVRSLFDSSNEFIQSDIVADYGHEIVDVTRMGYENAFDVIMCLNVLEHVYDFHTAIENIHRALRPGGRVVVVVPVFFPFHDEPYDFWRFTEYALHRVLGTFSSVDLKHRGLRQMPFSYFVVARK
jgi:SAM-dependent methyltransferase